MASTGKTTTLDQFVADLEGALPALRELAEVQVRLEAARKAESAAKESAESAERACQRTVNECAGKVTAAQENMSKRLADIEAELLRRSAEARKSFEEWQVTAKATKAREEAESLARRSQINALAEQVAGSTHALSQIEKKLDAARTAYREALAGVSA